MIFLSTNKHQRRILSLLYLAYAWVLFAKRVTRVWVSGLNFNVQRETPTLQVGTRFNTIWDIFFGRNERETSALIEIEIMSLHFTHIIQLIKC